MFGPKWTFNYGTSLLQGVNGTIGLQDSGMDEPVLYRSDDGPEILQGGNSDSAELIASAAIMSHDFGTQEEYEQFRDDLHRNFLFQNRHSIRLTQERLIDFRPFSFGRSFVSCKPPEEKIYRVTEGFEHYKHGRGEPVELFDIEGKLLRMDLGPNSLVFMRDKSGQIQKIVQIADGIRKAALLFFYNSDGLVGRIQAIDACEVVQAEVTYLYDGGRLTSVLTADGKEHHYEYSFHLPSYLSGYDFGDGFWRTVGYYETGAYYLRTTKDKDGVTQYNSRLSSTNDQDKNVLTVRIKEWRSSEQISKYYFKMNREGALWEQITEKLIEKKDGRVTVKTYDEYENPHLVQIYDECGDWQGDESYMECPAHEWYKYKYNNQGDIKEVCSDEGAFEEGRQESARSGITIDYNERGEIKSLRYNDGSFVQILCNSLGKTAVLWSEKGMVLVYYSEGGGILKLKTMPEDSGISSFILSKFNELRNLTKYAGKP